MEHSKQSLTFIDLFAGIGGFRHGMELAGHKCLGYCEFDKYASASYRMMHTVTEEQRRQLSSKYLDNYNVGITGLQWYENNNKNAKRKRKLLEEVSKEEYLNGEWYSNDIRTVNAWNVPRADVWCFGAPCQDFSIAGARKGMAGDRSCLVREVFRVLKSLKEADKPEWIIYENVRGMLSSEKGFDFLGILLEMGECGYDIEWQLFNSKDWGVPQNRERVYTIGHLRSRCSRTILPITGTDFKVGNDIIRIAHANNFRRYNQVYSINGSCESLDTSSGGGHQPCVMTVYNVNPSGNGMNGNVFDSNRLSPTLTTNKGEGLKVAIPVLTPDRLEKRQNGRRFKEDGEPMFTLTAQDRHGVAILTPKRTEYGKQVRKQYENHEIQESRHNMTQLEPRTDGISNTITTVQKDNYLLENMRIRKLTPRECFRLQGWEDIYFDRAALVNSDSQLYKQSGNGVTTTVVYAIGEVLANWS